MIGIASLSCLGAPSGSARICQVARYLSEPFHNAFLTLGIALLLVCHWRDRQAPCWREVAIVLLGQTALVHALKFLTGRCLGLFPRPSGAWGGFPSGHASVACALAVLLTVRFPRLWPLWFGCASAIAWSRRDAGAHFGYQIVVGALLGSLVALLLHSRIRRR